jgi:hypothetical protein
VTASLPDWQKSWALVLCLRLACLLGGRFYNRCGQKAALGMIPDVDGPPPAADIKVYYFCHIRPLTVGRCAVFLVRRGSSLYPVSVMSVMVAYFGRSASMPSASQPVDRQRAGTGRHHSCGVLRDDSRAGSAFTRRDGPGSLARPFAAFSEIVRAERQSN